MASDYPLEHGQLQHICDGIERGTLDEPEATVVLVPGVQHLAEYWAGQVQGSRYCSLGLPVGLGPWLGHHV